MKKEEIKKYIKKTIKSELDKLITSGELVELKELKDLNDIEDLVKLDKKNKKGGKKKSKAKAK